MPLQIEMEFRIGIPPPKAVPLKNHQWMEYTLFRLGYVDKDQFHAGKATCSEHGPGIRVSCYSAGMLRAQVSNGMG